MEEIKSFLPEEIKRHTRFVLPVGRKSNNQYPFGIISGKKEDG
mgnify:CR=1 FL=1